MSVSLWAERAFNNYLIPDYLGDFSDTLLPHVFLLEVVDSDLYPWLFAGVRDVFGRIQ